MNGEATRFKIGNKEAEKWTEDKVGEVFTAMLENTSKDHRILCLQDSIRSVDLYTSSINYLINKFPVFKNIKNDIQDIIISRINKSALEGDYNPATSIWRMKQLGERDTQYQEVKSDVKQTNIISLGKGKKPD